MSHRTHVSLTIGMVLMLDKRLLQYSYINGSNYSSTGSSSVNWRRHHQWMPNKVLIPGNWYNHKTAMHTIYLPIKIMLKWYGQRSLQLQKKSRNVLLCLPSDNVHHDELQRWSLIPHNRFVCIPILVRSISSVHKLTNEWVWSRKQHRSWRVFFTWFQLFLAQKEQVYLFMAIT